MASAAASSNYTASASTGGASNYATTTVFNDDRAPKFNEYRSRVMLGDLPQDFLRIHLVQAQVYDPAGHSTRQGYSAVPMQQQIQQNPNFLGYFTLTVAEAKLVKGSSMLGLVKIDPYVSFRIGHVSYDTQTATGGGKSPQWKASYRINLFKGMDRINLEVYDQRNFTEDAFLGECEILIPQEVMAGETRQHWYPLMGRQANANENQGDILIIMSFMPIRTMNQPAPGSSIGAPFGNPTGNTNTSTDTGASLLAAQSNNTSEQQSTPQHSPSATPKPPLPPYSQEDVRTIEEMFPTTDRHTIIGLFNQHGGNKDLVVNQLLQNIA